jgi:hypothetical protein
MKKSGWIAIAILPCLIMSFGTGTSKGQDGIKEIAIQYLARELPRIIRDADCLDKLGSSQCSQMNRCRSSKTRLERLSQDPLGDAAGVAAYIEDSNNQCQCMKALHEGNWSRFIDSLYEVACDNPDPRHGYPDGCDNQVFLNSRKRCVSP